MKPSLSIILGLSLLGGVISQAILPASANEIDWQEVPGTQSSDELGESAWFVGDNTIARNGNAINFDILETAHYEYLRVSGNCQTGWMNVIASGHYDTNGEIVIQSRLQRPLEVQHNKPMLSLQFACSKSR